MTIEGVRRGFTIHTTHSASPWPLFRSEPCATNITMKTIKLTGAQSKCAACNLLFKSTAAFDQHRTGPHTARRCLTLAELTAAGFAPNAAAFLRVPAPVGTFAARRAP